MLFRSQLDRGHRALLTEKSGDWHQAVDVVVFPDPEIGRADPPPGYHGTGFDHNRPGPADGAAPEVNQMPVGREPIHAGVLTHGRDGDPVPEGHVPNGERFEESHGSERLFDQSANGVLDAVGQVLAVVEQEDPAGPAGEEESKERHVGFGRVA